MAKGKMSDDEKRWQAEDDIRALSKAEEVKAEHAKDPERKKYMEEMAKKRMMEMASMMGGHKE